MDNQFRGNNQQPELNLKSKYALRSFISGIISIIPALFYSLMWISYRINLGFLTEFFKQYVNTFWILGIILMYFASLVSVLAGLFGLIYGIKGLKSPKRDLAIAGIALSLIGSVLMAYFSIVTWVATEVF